MSLVEKLFGSFSDRELKKVNPIVKQVLALEPKYAALSDAELQAQTPAFKQQLADTMVVSSGGRLPRRVVSKPHISVSNDWKEQG